MRDPVGVWFSELKDNWESCAYFYDCSPQKNIRHDDSYRRYGDLPDGSHYGAALLPGNETAPCRCVIQIVEKKGEMRGNVPAEHACRKEAQDPWPFAAAASPGGKSIVWIKDGELWAWHQDPREKRFRTDDESCLTVRLGGRRVLDARMHADGVLELLCEGRETLGYFCDGDILLTPLEDGWTAIEKELWRVKAFHALLPESVAVLIRGEDEIFDYYNCGAQRVRFEPGLETIKEGILAENYRLEAVVIPAWVERVESSAFGSCANLRELAVEGDPRRLADWSEDAFAGCPCEEYYRTLRKAALSCGGHAQRMWKARVRDVEEILHDPELFELARQIEAFLGHGARMMLRPGAPSEIRILVEAREEEKCLPAMLRLTKAAEKKGFLTGPVEEERD